MAKVRVYNDNVHPFKQKFKDEIIYIAPGRFVEMDREEAVLFLGTGYPLEYDYNGEIKPETFKKLRKAPAPSQSELEAERVAAGFYNHATGEKYDSEAEYLSALKKDEALLERNKLANEREVEPNDGKKRKAANGT